jgi:hypothetical protein
MRCLSASAGSSRCFVGIATYDGSGEHQSIPSPGTNRYGVIGGYDLPNDDIWYEFEGKFTGTADTANSFRPGTVFVTAQVLCNYNQTGRTVEIDYLSFEDVTETNAAAGHATAAALSAAAASASETEAGQSANAAQTSEVNAGTHATSAQSSANSAAGSATDAAGHSSSAATYATSALATLGSIEALQGNFEFHHGTDNWDMSGGGSLITGSGFSAGKAIKAVGQSWGYYDIPLPVSRARTYRVRVRVKANGTGGSSRFYCGLKTMKSDLSRDGWNKYFVAHNVYVPNDDQWREYEGTITGDAEFGSETVFASPMFLCNYEQDDETHVMEVDYCIFEDVNELAAEASILQSAVADLEGNAASSITMRTQAGSSGATLELVAADDPSGAVSAARISADNILLNGTVQAQHMGVTSLSALVAEIGHFKSAPSGERVEIEDDRIRVFDNSDVPRVIIGRLD